MRDQSRQSPGSVSGPTSSGSFALTLIRGSLQRAILGPVQLARRPASHPPDQCQGSAVTYVALCVVSDIAIKKRFYGQYNYRATLRVACRSGRSASDMQRRLLVRMPMHWHLGRRTSKRYNDLNAIGKPLILSQTTKIKHNHQKSP
ncbi:Nucleotidyltransferase/DNA polymerase involved in DNA repair [Pseudomonas syringae pv. actinidiae]|uniref:Nucleotidyltransferase/DNA polymerase involved in DNA repair n=5 Tax=Pseudomonas syringae TaxID=317 RepID=A0AAN4Q4G1_PSESF|nr:Nucleotidyltransferase/DNA polymerase involved in DNA repair [Pseudomonas syringae pv. actinidiae]